MSVDHILASHGWPTAQSIAGDCKKSRANQGVSDNIGLILIREQKTDNYPQTNLVVILEQISIFSSEKLEF